MPKNSAGRIPFFVKDGKIVFCLVAEINGVIDREFIRQNCGAAAANLVPEKFIMYGLPRGTNEGSETIAETAGRESVEEIHYNATGKPMYDEDKTKLIPPHNGPIKEYLAKRIKVEGKRGAYDLDLFLDRIEPYSFTPKPMEDRPELKIKERLGNVFQEGGAWGSIANLKASLKLMQKLSRERAVMRNPKVKELIDAQIKSMESQFAGMQEIETDLIRILRSEGEKVRPSGAKAVG